MSLHKEIEFENDLCAHLATHGWLYAAGDAPSYDRARALYPADVLAWVQATQPKAWEVPPRVRIVAALIGPSLGASMKVERGSIRTRIQGPRGSAAVAA